MLTVPVIDQTAMGAQPYAAPGVTPMRNDAPQQLEQSGQAVQQAGAAATKTGNDITDALNTQVDLASVKQKFAASLSQVNDINNDPSTGFLNQRGQNAVDQYQPAMQAVNRVFQDARNSLSNPIQRQMFQSLAQQDQLGIREQMMRHNFQQTAQMSGEADLSAANMKAQNAGSSYSSYGQTDADGNLVGDFEANRKSAEQLTLNAVGVTKGAPADSPIAKEAVLKVDTQIGVSVLSQMMDARAPFSKVRSVYDDMKSRGMLDLQATDTLGRMVKTYTEQESQRANSNLYLSDAYRASQGQPTSSTGTPDYEFPVNGAAITTQPYDPDKGSVILNVPNGSSIQAPADGKVTGIGDNGNGHMAVQIQHPDGSVTSFYGMNASNVKIGDQVQRGEDLGPGSGAVLWALADKDGNAVDPTKAGLGPVDLSKIVNEKDLDSALTSMRKNVTDPYQQQQTANEMTVTVRRNQQEDNARKAENLSQGADAFYQGGMKVSNIPPTTFGQLTPEQQQHFKDLETEHVLQSYNQGQAFKNMSETDLVSDFVTNPDMLTPANVEAARAKLANSTYLQLMNKAQEQATNPKGVVEAQGVNDRIKYFAAPAGVNVDPKTPADKQTMIDLTYAVNNSIDQIKTQNHGKATADQVDNAIKQQLIQRTVSTPRAWGAWNPLAILGSPNSATPTFQFKIPAGATGVVAGSDGKMHYTDGKKDLGVVQ